MEYMPYGETWIEEGNDNQKFLNYLFTSKEFDSETGLYYFGARYLDPVTSRWMSCDPILGDYLPTGDKERDKNLPGYGGVFNSININLYHYAGNNPIKYIDPTGLDLYIVITAAKNGVDTGHVTIAVGNEKGFIRYDLSPEDVAELSGFDNYYNKDVSGSFRRVKSQNLNDLIKNGDVVFLIKTTKEEDQKILDLMESFNEKWNGKIVGDKQVITEECIYNAIKNSCTTIALFAIKTKISDVSAKETLIANRLGIIYLKHHGDDSKTLKIDTPKGLYNFLNKRNDVIKIKDNNVLKFFKTLDLLTK